MELEFYGANCIKISNRKTTVVVDDNVAQYGLKPVATAKDIVLATNPAVELPAESHFSIHQPGEYEVSDVSIQGIPAISHLDDPNETAQNTTMYRIVMDNVRIGIVGHIYPKLNDVQLEALGTLDILFVPVGGNGYTLDGIGAQKIIKDIEPRVVVPTHYEDAKFNFEIPQTPLDDAVKALGMEVADRLDTLKLKNFDFGEGTRLFILNRR